MLLIAGCAARPPLLPSATAAVGTRIEVALSPETGAEALVLKVIKVINSAPAAASPRRLHLY